MEHVLGIILGGGQGSRLYPLTKMRAKPALPLAGKYRLIDIPVSNCINSGIEKIYVLTQYNSASLNQHINYTYRFSPFSPGFVEVLAAQQTMYSPDWFQGTADAVRKALWVLKEWKVKEYLILSGDHLYRMNYRHFIEYHRRTKADVTISVVPIDEQRASSFGLLKIDRAGQVTDFKEKPKGEALKSMHVDTQILGLDATTAQRMPYIASMGIYVFRMEALNEMLKHESGYTDFGRDLIPAAIKNYNVQAYLFGGYWEDIGTIESFYKANLALVEQPNPMFSFFDAEFPIFTRPRFLPPSKILNCSVDMSMVCDGCLIRSTKIRNSIIGVRSRIEDNSVIENSLLMGADDYQSFEDRSADISSGIPPVGIGANTHIRKAVVDKNARIGQNVKIINKDNVQFRDGESEGYAIRSGIVVILKGATIPDNTVI